MWVRLHGAWAEALGEWVVGDLTPSFGIELAASLSMVPEDAPQRSPKMHQRTVAYVVAVSILTLLTACNNKPEPNRKR